MARIVHLSDLHFGAHDDRLVEAVEPAVDEESPTWSSICGDFTQRARTEQFKEACRFPRRGCATRGHEVLGVPGNHDVPLYDVLRRFLSPLTRYRRFIDDTLCPFIEMPGAAVLGINTARSLTFKDGRINDEQMRLHPRHLRAHASAAQRAILVTHHPLFALPVGDGPELGEAIGRQELRARRHRRRRGRPAARRARPSRLDPSTRATSSPAPAAALVIQAGTATSTRLRDEEQSFNRIEIDEAACTRHGAALGRRTHSSPATRSASSGTDGHWRLASGERPSRRTELVLRRAGVAMRGVNDDARFPTALRSRRIRPARAGRGPGLGRRRHLQCDHRRRRALHRRDELPRADRRRRTRDRVAFFRALDRDVRIEALASDGDACRAGTVLMRLDGNARAMLAAERSALNTLQHLSGIATLTRRYVDAIEGTGAILLDTRKTIPGLRLLEKYAARMGGAQNHRMRLDDGLLIKDNHVGVCGGVAEAVRAAKAANTGLPIQVEVDRIEQIEPALAAGADRLLLDNMEPPTCCARRSRWSPAGCRSRRRAGSTSTPSAPSPRPASTISRSGGSPSRRRRSISASIIAR